MTATRNPNGPSWAISPRDWGAQVDYDTWTDPVFDKDAIAIHHGGGGDYAAAKQPYSQATEEALLRKWERYHLSKKWRGIGYGYGIGMTGTVYRLRGWNNYGAHTGDLDGDRVANNKDIVPIILLMSGMANRHVPSEEMLAGFDRLWAYLEVTEGGPLLLFGHQEVQTKGTSCPGPNNMAWIRQNRNSRTVQVTPPPKHVPPPEEEEPEVVSPGLPPVLLIPKRRSYSTGGNQSPILPSLSDSLAAWISEEQNNLNRAGFRDQRGQRLKVDGVGGTKTTYARLQRDIAASENGVPYGKPIRIEEIKT